MPSDLTIKPVDDLVTILKGVGLRASVDAARLNLPGVWISVDGVAQVNVAGTLELRCFLFLIVGDKDPRRALAQLLPLYQQLLEAITPDGPVVTQGVVLPDNPTPMPALRVPLNLYL